MELEFGPMTRKEIREAAEVATRAFDYRTIEYGGKVMGSWSVKMKL